MAAGWCAGRRTCASALVLLLLVGLVTAVVFVRRPLPQTDGRVAVPGLVGTVEVIRDAHGIPQLYADSVDDLMRAQGYVHAQERFFEMDLRRHVTAGRLSEMFGEEHPRHRQADPHDGLAAGRRAGAARSSTRRPATHSRRTPTG